MTQSPIEKAKEALRPLAALALMFEGDEKDLYQEIPPEILLKAFRRAAEALKALEGE